MSAVIAECPHCHSQYTLDENLFARKATVEGRCAKCGQKFSVPAPAAQKSAAWATQTVVGIPAARAAAAPAAAEATRVAKGGEEGHLPADKIVALSVTQGSQRGRIFRLTKPEVLVGRLGTDIVIDDALVSRKHCMVRVNGTSATITDLGTTNGTFVEGERVTSHELQHLSEFRIGNTILMFTVVDKTT